MSLGLFAVQAYLAANAYVQARAGAPMAVSASEPLPGPVHGNHLETHFSDAPSVFFPAGASHRSPNAWTPYRSAFTVRLPHTTLPQEIVDYLINRSQLTGHHYSLFRHGPASRPSRYEVREGSPSASDRSVLGGETYDVFEESFFDVTWVAHVHPPSRNPLPTDDDLNALAERACHRRGRCFRHTLFGFLRGEPVFIEFQVMVDPFTRGITVLHRASESVAAATDARIQDFISSYR
ncbi:MAG TPA: hypothetical protein VLJ37_06790 [bacterium]|nr:hypothetical protein [bacterium]